MTPEGLLLIDKPAGITSHDAVQVVRRKLGLRRIGHAGTLDPLARGLLLLLVGNATRHQQAFQHYEKTYEASLKLGIQMDTGDADGKVVRTAPVPELDREIVRQVLVSFEGPCRQVPPAYSAVKVQGRPAYWWTRHGKTVTLNSRIVQVLECRLLDCQADLIHFRIHCSSGTYVRTLAESIAEKLGTVGHLLWLTRLRVGQWRLEQAKPIRWVEQASPTELLRELIPVRST
ncbi:MAG: tRNA pseudouridine(55) synthase TruB [Candidatus Omnitrophica bacterium]|nr:tRNA pseudouridine(55) synthase TruB [Candidatus Omnitrophota bacterium]MBI2174705.1 tRNA pseudouridine(55) synthase TruB [Candidatus Omnitrophota bacterium]MBI3010276.1 tRNA pseudouridine(55) synthase TruB [Candidatus Omnitrophota bacterium]